MTIGLEEMKTFVCYFQKLSVESHMNAFKVNTLKNLNLISNQQKELELINLIIQRWSLCQMVFKCQLDRFSNMKSDQMVTSKNQFSINTQMNSEEIKDLENQLQLLTEDSKCNLVNQCQQIRNT